MSGTALNYGAISEINEHLEISYQLAENMGKSITHFNDLVELLKSESPENLVNSLLPMTNSERTMKVLLGAVIEREIIIVKLSQTLN